MKPASSPSNGNPITSPLLDALSSATFTQSSSQNTNEWAKNVPAYSSSPSNLVDLGEFPPTLPSSYEDRLSNFGWTTREQRGIRNGHLPSASPPANGRRRPLSFQLDGDYPRADDYRSQVSSYAARRSSMYSQHPRYAQHPPLPHQAQAHFYGAPDANLMLSPPAPGLIPGENGYYCGFDTLPREKSKSADKVVVTGYDGGINVYSVTKRELSKILTIDGIRGGVYNAKILPWSVQGGDCQHFPLIAMVVHGPVWPSSDGSSGDDSPPLEGIYMPHTVSARGSPGISGQQVHETDSIEYYQTTVEVYSLSTKQHFATLLSVPKTHLAIPTTSPMLKAPPPVGSLTIRADGGYLIVTSGSTGETWIFRQADADPTVPAKFKCMGKLWTTVQHGITTESTGVSGLHDSDWHSNDPSSMRKLYNSSIVSLNGRFLAYCPPSPSSQISLRATVPGMISTARVLGLNAHAPPQLPPVNCQVETPGGENMVKQLLQAGTQNLIKGATYLGGQGVQAWNSYWNKPSSSQLPSGGISYQPQPNMVHHFPPTHGAPAPGPVVAKDPGLISILDLESLSQQGSLAVSYPHPLATFRVPHGCSFLSFAPSGLALFTASSKGDVQFVWDLMRIQFAKSSFLKGGFQSSGILGPHVRQIAQFSRMTIARIVDVVWTSPHGERAAMVTEPGTVHVLDLPASAFTWPPPRRRVAAPKPDEGSGEIAGSILTASGVASSAVNSLWTAARPLVSRRRRSSSGMSAMTVAAQAGHGTQALAAGISRSVGAATGRMNEMRKSGNTKLHLPRSSTIPSKRCVLLLTGKKSDSVIVVGGGIVRFYTIKNRRADRPADKQKASRGAKYVEFRLPSLPDPKFAPELGRELGDLELTERDIEDHHWKSRQSPAPAKRSHGTESSIPQAEIESNAPYQPFHTDRRVGLYNYSHEESPLLSPSVSALLSPPQDAGKSTTLTNSKAAWAFGGLIRTIKLDVGPSHNPDDDFDPFVEHRALPSSAIERVMRLTDSNEDMEQIVVTTRRRKGVSRIGIDDSGDVDEEGFFENDCDVLDFASQRV
jgi:hypothetical protein